MDKDYYLGLDMGTSSVGWAVTDKNYHIIKFQGKDMWGMREFKEAQPAEERRTFRTSRRRRQRAELRISLLKAMFQDAIDEVDPNFFVRMDNSMFFPEDKDKRLSSVNSLFNDEQFTDRDYYQKYPTIFHLRQELIHNPEAHDVRLVYLAILNMFKRRGHFLDTSISSMNFSSDLSQLYKDARELLVDGMAIHLPDDPDIQQLSDLLCDKKIKKIDKTKQLIELLKIDKKNKKESAILQLMAGRDVKISKLDESISTDDDLNICFANTSLEDNEDQLVDLLGDVAFQALLSVKSIYDYASLKRILEDYDYLSDARVHYYEEHHKDLKKLKAVFKKYGTQEDYDAMFRSNLNASYSAYVNSNNSGIKQRRQYKERTKKYFYDNVKSFFNKWEKKNPEIKEDKDVQSIREKIDLETFMPKQLTASNGVIPNQVHFKELHKILENAKSYLSFLNEKDSSQLTVAERIERLYQFRIPYYVGPTSKDSQIHGNGWAIRKEPGLVLPWNIEDKIDLKKTSEAFINHLIRQCTYLSQEKVMPKNALLYQKFCVLNEINNIRIDEVRIEPQLKKDIYNELYKADKNVTKKKLINYLKARGVIHDEGQVTGIGDKINNQLSSYAKFKAIFGEEVEQDHVQKIAEDIIRWCTIYGDSKKFLREQLEEHYSDQLDSRQLKRILGFKFKDWAKLSRAFLELQGLDRETGEMTTLIDCMWNNNLNMMEIIHSDRFDFSARLQEKQGHHLKNLSEFQAEDLKDMYFSAPVKRMIWQTIRIIKEIVGIMGKPPKRLFIEMTRQEDDKKEMKDSRGQQLTALYKKIKDEERDWIKEIEDASENGKLRSKKLYLYYLQMGMDVYTGEPIELNDLFNKNMYDIDHIYPRHFTKDDNILNNLVLVRKDINNHKQDHYPLEEKIRCNPNVRKCWQFLLEKSLMSKEKYHRLTRTTAFTDEEKASFIARQLVETSQATKGVADILKDILGNETTIVYAKAANVSRFRGAYGFTKSRLVNDFHHAHDAYLNIVVGNAYYVKFTQDPMHFVISEYNKDAQKYNYNLSKMFDWNIKRGNEIAWQAVDRNGHGGTIETVRKVLMRNTPILSEMSFVFHGGLSNQNIISASVAKEEGYLPLKTNDVRFKNVKKYGGKKDPATAYFFLVKYQKGKKQCKAICHVPVVLSDAIEHDPARLEEYCMNDLKLKNPVVLMRKIKINSYIIKDGFYLHITGRSGKRLSVSNAVSLCLKPEWITYIKKLELNNANEIVTKEKNIALYDELIKKHTQTIYMKRPNSIGETLEKGRNQFIQLDQDDQRKVILEILKLTSIGNYVGDLQLIGGSKNAGSMKISIDISKCNQFTLVHQSVTGLFEKTIDLLKL